MSVDYGKTLNLRTNQFFGMRANLPQKEPAILKKWEEMDIYNKQLKKNEGKPKFILHDGPPYAKWRDTFRNISKQDIEGHSCKVFTV
jgi:isoleucyl-tRNA synthetase